MAKIDVSKIDGFETMSDAEKVAALTGLDLPDEPDKTKWVSKTTFDQKMAELGRVTKELRGKQTEEEQAAADRAAKEEADKAERAALLERAQKAEKALAVAGYKNSFLALGYEEKLAQETAEALADGKTDIVIANGAKYKTALEAKLKAELMNQDRTPGGGGSGNNGGEDADVAAAKRLAKARNGGNTSLAETLAKYT